MRITIISYSRFFVCLRGQKRPASAVPCAAGRSVGHLRPCSATTCLPSLIARTSGFTRPRFPPRRRDSRAHSVERGASHVHSVHQLRAAPLRGRQPSDPRIRDACVDLPWPGRALLASWCPNLPEADCRARSPTVSVRSLAPESATTRDCGNAVLRASVQRNEPGPPAE